MLFHMVWLLSEPKANRRLQAATEERSAAAWQAIGSLGRAIGKSFRAWSEAGARRRAEAGTVRELQLLSDRALADLGIHRSEIRGIAGDLVERASNEKSEPRRPKTVWAPPAWFSRETALAVGQAVREGALGCQTKGLEGLLWLRCVRRKQVDPKPSDLTACSGAVRTEDGTAPRRTGLAVN